MLLAGPQPGPPRPPTPPLARPPAPPSGYPPKGEHKENKLNSTLHFTWIADYDLYGKLGKSLENSTGKYD